jgi:hypothetical protein
MLNTHPVNGNLGSSAFGGQAAGNPWAVWTASQAARQRLPARAVIFAMGRLGGLISG